VRRRFQVVPVAVAAFLLLAVAGAICRFTSADCHLCLLTPGGCGPASESTTLASGFSEEVVASGLGYSISFAFIPDGYLFGTKEGLIRIWKNGALLPRPFLDLRKRVNSETLRGLLAIEADPAFSQNGFVYLLYVRENRRTPPGGSKTVVVTRVTAAGDRTVATRERILLGSKIADSCNDLPSSADCIPADGEHSGGDISVSGDGIVFVATGDGSTTGDLGNSLRSQNIDSLGGKVLRVNRDGEGVADNPFWTGDRNGNRSKVWAYGLRNPFRMTLGPRGEVVVADVGWNTSEEVNIANRGANLGWPCFEGDSRPRLYASSSVCRALYRRGDAVAPVFAYPTVGGGSRSSVTGGDFLRDDLYVYGDWSRDWLRSIDLRRKARGFAVGRQIKSAAGRPVEIAAGPDGAIYYLGGSGELRKISYDR